MYNQTAQTNGLLKICTIDVPDRKSKYTAKNTHTKRRR